MKKILFLIIVIGALVFLVMRYGGQKEIAPSTGEDGTADTTTSISDDLGAVDTGSADADLNALDADINSL